VFIFEEMKHAVAVILLFGLLTQMFSKELSLIEYSFNKEFISSELCVKKNVPDNDCQGKCHLKRELSRDDDTQPVSNTKVKTVQDVNLFYGEILTITFNNDFSFTKRFVYNVPLTGTFQNEVFHPPGC
jgi:hypothetical protein